MKYLLFSTFFLLVLVSCQKEESSPIRNHEFGNCLKDEEPIDFTLTHCNLRELDTLRYCELITSTSYFPLSEEAGDLLPYYCCEKGDTIPFVNAQGEKINLSILHKGRGKLVAQPTTKCEQDSSKMKLRCVNFETVGISITTPLSEQRLSVSIWPNFSNVSDSLTPSIPWNLNFSSLGEILSISNVIDRPSQHNNSFSFPIDTINTQPSSYDFQYLPEIEILGKTFFEVYTHEEDLNGFYTKIYYNKEFGIVSFVDATGMQWRVDW